jgi:PAS domain-containing protein
MGRIFENRALRRIFGTKRAEIVGRWRKLFIEELDKCYSSPDIIRNMSSKMIKLAGHVASMGDKTPRLSRPLGESRCR